MPYRLPVFNLVANVWHGALPADLLLGLTLPPSAPPAFSTACQLYISKYWEGAQYHAVPESVRSTLDRSGYAHLRCPLDTPIQAPWLPNPATTWADLDLVEVPAGSRRFYGVVAVEQAHMGFANEYRVGLLVQLADLSTFGIMGGGGGFDVGLAPPPAVEVDLAGGGGMASATGAPPPAVEVDLAGGGFLEQAITYGPLPAAGSTCSLGGYITIPAAGTVAIGAAVSHWYNLAVTVGHTYRIHFQILSGMTGATLSYRTGVCPGSVQWQIDGTSEQCGDFVAASSSTIHIQIANADGAGSYYLDVAEGTC